MRSMPHDLRLLEGELLAVPVDHAATAGGAERDAPSIVQIGAPSTSITHGTRSS